MEPPVNHLVAVFLWVLWCSLHSLLIAVPLTDYLKRRLRGGYRFYRLIYNIVALITLAPLAIYSFSIEEAPVFRWEGSLAAIKYLLFSASIYLFAAGARHYSLFSFLGIDQLRTGKPNRVLSERNVFATSGILGIIRHPWYTGGILIIWARDMSLLTLWINIVVSAYLVIGAFLEERKLLREFGGSYREYQKRVSMLFPWKWIINRVTRG